MMKNNNESINEIIDEITDVLNRSYWSIEMNKRPTKLQRIIANIFFKEKFRKIIKDEKLETL